MKYESWGPLKYEVGDPKESNSLPAHLYRSGIEQTFIRATRCNFPSFRASPLRQGILSSSQILEAGRENPRNP